jgi:hypothetical protein
MNSAQKKLNIFSDDIMTGLVCQQSAGLLECWTAGLEGSVLLYFVNLLVTWLVNSVCLAIVLRRSFLLSLVL